MDRRSFLLALGGVVGVAVAGRFAAGGAEAAVPVPAAPTTATAGNALLHPDADGGAVVEHVHHWRRRRRRRYFLFRRRRRRFYFRRRHWFRRRRIFIVL